MKQLLWIPIVIFAFILGCKKDEKNGTASITTATPSNITANSAQSGGDITSNGGSAISKSGVCFAMHNNPSISDSITSDDATGGSFSSSLSNLNANSTYFVRAYAINASGTAYGNTDSFTTSKGVPTVVTTAISNNTSLAANSGWTLINNGGAAITAIGICWSTSPHPTITSFKTTDSVTLNSFADTMAGLNITTYYVRAFATNSYGTGYGNEISFTVSATGAVTDIDGNAYLTVVIGSQTWMGSNLRVSHYNNGDPIINGFTTNFDWYGNTYNTSSLLGAYTFPNGDSTNNAIYGKLYNAEAVNDTRGICPAGWHVPTLGDFDALELSQGMVASDTGIYGGNYVETAVINKLLVGGSSGLNLQYSGEFVFGSANASTWAFASFATSAGVKVANYWTSTGGFFDGTQYLNIALPISSTFPYLVLSYYDDNAFPVRCIKN